ncbi:hypothetical protein BDZ94DRAFT_1310904 [Collybia nuda]|uniref:Uncharacterized protein n=1 Tax=Collybia nuda TaxID=64659 RepID=A0A9P6CGF2_9AGAR|nr:hypothetical protein BDZ94DRAFT_1310904 [Collybia nuda]
MNVNSTVQQQVLPSCRELIAEIDKLREKGVYEPQAPPAFLLPLKWGSPRPPFRGISNVKDQDDHDTTYVRMSTATPHSPPEPRVFLSRTESYSDALNASDTSVLKIPTNAPLDPSDARVETSENDTPCLVLSKASSDWYNDGQSSIPSPLSSLSLNLDNLKELDLEDQNTKCGSGEACLQVTHEALLKQYSFCSFNYFGSYALSRLYSRKYTRWASALPSTVKRVYTAALHDPNLGKYHFCLEIPKPAIEFSMSYACVKTRGVAVADILKFDGQCIKDSRTPVTSKLTKKNPQQTSINLVIEWKGYPREVVKIPIRCACGYEITKGQIALEIAHAHNDYFATNRCEDAYRASVGITTSIENLRLMSLHSPDKGTTWRAQHAVVGNLVYKPVGFWTQDGEWRSGVIETQRT